MLRVATAAARMAGSSRIPVGHRRERQEARIHARGIADPARRDARHRARRAGRRRECDRDRVSDHDPRHARMERPVDAVRRALRAMTLRPAAALLLAAGLALSTGARGQPATPAANGTKPEAPPAYEDRLIEGGSLAPDSLSDDAAAYNAQGWPRFWRIEGVSSYYDQQGLITRENGARFQRAHRHADSTARSLGRRHGASRPGSFIATLVQRGHRVRRQLVRQQRAWRGDHARHRSHAQRNIVSTFPRSPRSAERRNGSTTATVQLQASVGRAGKLRRLSPRGLPVAAAAAWRPRRAVGLRAALAGRRRSSRRARTSQSP